MPRPPKCRRICANPDVVYFKPAGIMMKDLDEVVLTLDEFEAVRLADDLGLYQEQAAAQMNVSRQTFGNIINSAHKKIADFLVNAKALKISGGSIEMSRAAADGIRTFECPQCKFAIDVPVGTPKPEYCPKCSSGNLHRAGIDNQNI